MKYSTFSVGDTVRRNIDNHMNVRQGENYIVSRLDGASGIELQGQGTTIFSSSKFTLITKGDGTVKQPEMPADAAMSDDPRITARGNYMVPVTYKTVNLHCCGIKEYHGTQGQILYEKNYLGTVIKAHSPTPLDILKGMCTYWRDVSRLDRHDITYYRARPFMIFSVARGPREDEKDYLVGQEIAALIEQNGLGTVWTSPWELNGNSQNLVQMFVWNVNRETTAKAYVDAQHL